MVGANQRSRRPTHRSVVSPRPHAVGGTRPSPCQRQNSLNQPRGPPPPPHTISALHAVEPNLDTTLGPEASHRGHSTASDDEGGAIPKAMSLSLASGPTQSVVHAGWGGVMITIWS